MKVLSSIILVAFLVNISFADSPSVEDITNSNEESTTSSSETNTPQYRVKWERSIEAMLEGMKYATSRLRSKYPAQETKRSQMGQVWVNNDLEVELFQNVTPEKLNTPDIEGQPLPGEIAVFVMKVKVITRPMGYGGLAHQVNRFYQNANQLTGGQTMQNPLGDQATQSQVREKNKMYVISMPRRPFMRSFQNPFMNPMSMAAFQAGGMNMQGATEIKNKEVKSIFPSDKPVMKSVNESELRALLSGRAPSSSDDE